MQVIHLPRQLPQATELVRLNKLLRSEAIRLDWSDVQATITPQQLNLLLRGLSLSQHIELLGASTMSDTVSQAVSAAFDYSEADQDITLIGTPEVASAPTEYHLPELWVPNISISEITMQQATGEQSADHSYPPVIPALTELCLDMRDLAHAKMREFPALLQPLVNTYAGQINQQQQHSRDTYQESHLPSHGMLRRIQAGIFLINTDRDAARAFSFMNRAMWLQRIHTIQAEQQQQHRSLTASENDQPANRSWHPSQLAFILLAISAHTDQHPNTGDMPDNLLWFPTGTSKVEAFLGLLAYILGIRRLRNRPHHQEDEQWLTVVMRSTLRPFTIQRAITLICACEIIRRTDRNERIIWGTIPFRLGLWAGATSSSQTMGRNNIHEQHLRPLTHCPWCGIETGVQRDASGKRGNESPLFYCSDQRCPFSYSQSPSEGIPILSIHDQIQRLVPDRHPSANTWFPPSTFSLAIPDIEDTLDTLITEFWSILQGASTLELLRTCLHIPMLKENLRSYSVEAIWAKIAQRRRQQST